MFQEIIIYDWRHICYHCYVANRSITSWLVYLAARLAATILNATPLIVRSHSKVHRSRGNPKEIPT